MSHAYDVRREVCMLAALYVVPTLVLALSCSGLAPMRAQAQTSRPLEKINFLLDFTPYGKHAPFFAALDRGFWRDAGFDATIIKGEGSATTVASYAAGAVDFAF